MPPDMFTDETSATDDVMAMFWDSFDASPKSSALDELELSQTRAARLESENEALKQKLSEYESQFKKAKQAALPAQNQQIETEKKCKTYEQKIDGLEQLVRGLQAGALQSVEATQWAPLSNADIEHRMKVIEAAICHWAQTHARFRIDVVLDDFDFFSEPIVQEACVQEDVVPTLWEAFARNETMQKQGKAAAMLLSAAASTYIFRWMFGNPFFAFCGRDEQGDLLWEGHRRTLFALQQAMRKHDKSGAEAWRCQLLRLLDPLTAEKNCKAAGSRIAAEFFQIYQIDTGDECFAEMLSELTAIAQQAATFAWKLWTGKARMQVEVVGGYRDEIYHFARGDVEPHTLHGKDIDEGPETLDGREILLMCSPLVMVTGTADGGDYNELTVLKKAVVWMG